MRGCVKLLVHDAVTNRSVWWIQSPNLFVTQGYNELRKILAGDGASDHYVKFMQFGTGAADPAAVDTFLQTPVGPQKLITTVTHPLGSPYEVQFEASLGPTEGNGFRFTEAGLFTNAGLLLARSTFAPSPQKTSDYIFLFQWTITAL